MRVTPRFFLVLAFCLGSYCLSAADLPRAILVEILPCGARVGTTLDVTIRGTDLDETDALVFSDPRIRAESLTEGPGPFERPKELVPLKYRVTVPDEVEPGVYDVRSRGLFGLSNPRAFVVSRAPLTREVEANGTFEVAQVLTLETTVHGAVRGANEMDFYRFRATSGTRLLIDCRARRIDSDLEAVMVLSDEQGNELVTNRGDRTRDPFIDFAVPAHGDYVLKIHDVIFRGGPSYFYHLRLGTYPHVDFVFPPAGMPGSRGRYTLYGRNLPGAVEVPELTIGDRPLERLEVDIHLPWKGNTSDLPYRLFLPSQASFVDATAYRFRTSVDCSNPVFLALASAPVVIEAPENDAPAKSLVVPVPCELVGQFYPAADQDWVLFNAGAGEVYWLEVFSHRLGQLTDPHLLVRRFRWDDKGEIAWDEMGANDDLGGVEVGGRHFNIGTDDAAFRLAVGEADAYPLTQAFPITYGVLVRDLFSGVTADPRNVYRLSIRRESPDFRLVAVPRKLIADVKPEALPVINSVFLRSGGTAVVDVLAERQHGMDRKIEIFARHLPEGVRTKSVFIAPGQRKVSLVLEANLDVPDWQGNLRVFGRAYYGDTMIEREARSGTVVVSSGGDYRSRLTQGVRLTVSAADKFPFTVSAAADKLVYSVARAGKLTIPVKVDRREGHQGPLILTPIGVPPNVEAKPVTLAPDKLEGQIELQTKKETPVGLKSFYVRCQAKVQHRRNPAAVERAGAWKQKMEKIVKDLEAQKAAATDGDKAAIEKRLQEAIKERDRANGKEAELAKAAAPTSFDVFFPSMPITMKVVQTPFDLKTASAALKVTRGTKSEFTVTVPRHSGFEGEIEVQLVLPESVKGVTTAPIKLAKDQSEAKFVLELAEDASVGRHAVSFKGVTSFAEESREMSVGIVLEVR